MKPIGISNLAMAAIVLSFSAVGALAQTTLPAAKPIGPLSPELLPGNGLSQHPFLYAGEWWITIFPGNK